MKEWIVPIVAVTAFHGAVAALPVSLGWPQQETLPPRLMVSLQFLPPPAPPKVLPKKVERPRPKKRRAGRKVMTPDPVEAPQPQVLETPPAPLQEEAPDDLSSEQGEEDRMQPEAQPPAPSVPAPVAGSREGLDAYGRGLYRLISAHKRYPTAAMRLRLRGEALVRLVLRGDGTMARPPVLLRSTGHAVLDREALRMVTAAAPFAPLPASYAHTGATLVVPLRFMLE